MATLYPAALRNLQLACDGYRNGSSSLDNLQAAVWNTAQTIVAVEERELRDYLQVAEGQLERVRFMTDDENIFTESLKIVSQIEDEIARWQGRDTPR